MFFLRVHLRIFYRYFLLHKKYSLYQQNSLLFLSNPKHISPCFLWIIYKICSFLVIMRSLESWNHFWRLSFFEDSGVKIWILDQKLFSTLSSIFQTKETAESTIKLYRLRGGQRVLINLLKFECTLSFFTAHLPNELHTRISKKLCTFPKVLHTFREGTHTFPNIVHSPVSQNLAANFPSIPTGSVSGWPTFQPTPPPQWEQGNFDIFFLP